ncbi:MAG: CapA family protein [Polyangiales bacterium]
MTTLRRATLVGCLAASVIPASAFAQATPECSAAGSDCIRDNDVENAFCTDAPLTSYLVNALFPVTSNPNNVPTIPRSKVFVPASQRAGLNPKRIVVFGDLFAMDKDTPAFVAPEVRSLFASADLILGNIEAPVTLYNGVLEDSGNQFLNFHANVAYLDSALTQFCMDPSKTVLTVANNHSGDKNRWEETWKSQDWMKKQTQARPTLVGVHDTSASAEIEVKNVGGLKVGIVGWTHLQNSAAQFYKGTTWQPSRQVTRATDWSSRKQALGLNMLIGLPHWDCQWHWFPQPYTVRTTDALHDKGFDLIAGSHPSVLQPGKLFPGVDRDLAFYSLGHLNAVGSVGTQFLAIAVEIVVDQRGNTLQYTLRPLVVRKLGTGKELMLPANTGCSSIPDKSRPTNLDIVPLETLKNGTSLERVNYSLFNDHLDKVFPK